jgi:hypothetical protein
MRDLKDLLKGAWNETEFRIVPLASLLPYMV